MPIAHSTSDLLSLLPVIEIDSPTQVNLSAAKINPSLHEQWKLPIVFVHTSKQPPLFTWHSFSSVVGDGTVEDRQRKQDYIYSQQHHLNFC